MNPEQARKLVEDTLTQPFERSHFLRFTQELLNHLQVGGDRQKVYRGAYVTRAFAEKIGHYERLGTYIDPEGEVLDVIAVYLKRETTLERGRTSLRNFGAHYLTKRSKSAVLAAFVAPNESEWRFSFVKLEYALEQTHEGKVRERKELTPARRYSFIVGPHEGSHTAQKQLLPLLENDQSDPLLSEIESAFDIERVTKEFFARYKELFEDVRDALKALLDGNEGVREDFALKSIETDDFAKKLLGQIVFLYFLQKKGWFGVESNAPWGTGNKNYLRHLFERREIYYQRGNRQIKRNFFNDILEPLFYNTLATERTNDYSDRFDCKIPFLNGGLFEPLFGYDWVNTDILLPDELFSNDKQTKEGDVGKGILDVFDRYNFTVNEAEPLEKDVAVDPEMLGKVFENLLPENLRHKGGAYYTPRVIVNYMCQQSLINYHVAHLPEVPRADIETFINLGSVQADFEAARTQDHKDKFLPESISRKAESVDTLLEDITVCDPAIGSGAFPVGMMQEIVRARSALTSVTGLRKRSVYELKRHAIQNSLYGVDIDPSAIEIAKLRLWLSLVVDEEDRAQIKALPNLDYKIIQGNSLVDEFAGVKLLDENFIQKNADNDAAILKDLKEQVAELRNEAIEIRKGHGKTSAQAIKHEQRIDDLLKQIGLLAAQPEKQSEELFVSESKERLALLKQRIKEYANETSQESKKRLRSEIELIEWQFMEKTLKERKEFDALHELEKHRHDNRRNYFLWELNFAEVFQAKGGFDVVIANPPYVLLQDDNRDPHLYAYFRRQYSVASFKIDLYHLFIEQGVKLLNRNGSISYITPSNFVSNNYTVALRRFLLTETNLSKLIFFDDNVFEAKVNNLILIAQKHYPNTSAVSFYKATTTKSDLKVNLQIKLPQSELLNEKALLIPVSNIDSYKLIKKFEERGKTLGQLASVNFGMQLRDRKKFKNDVIQNPSPSALTKYHRKCYTGKDIGKYYVRFDNRYCYFNREAKRGGCWDERVHNAKNKILIKQIGPYPEGGLDTKGYAVLNTAFMVLSNDKSITPKYLTAILNSACVQFYWRNKFKDDRKTFPKIKGEYLELIPIPPATEAQQTLISTLVDYVMFLKENTAETDSHDNLVVSYFEQLIDALVYELYLSDEIHDARKQFFHPLAEARLPALEDIQSDKLDTLRQLFAQLFDRNHIIRQNIFFLDTIQSVRIIEGKT